MILAIGIGNLIFSIFSGQPLVILGATGPTIIFEQIIFNFCSTYDIPFLNFRFWIGMWTTRSTRVLWWNSSPDSRRRYSQPSLDSYSSTRPLSGSESSTGTTPIISDSFTPPCPVCVTASSFPRWRAWRLWTSPMPLTLAPTGRIQRETAPLACYDTTLVSSARERVLSTTMMSS